MKRARVDRISELTLQHRVEIYKPDGQDEMSKTETLKSLKTERAVMPKTWKPRGELVRDDVSKILLGV